MSYYETCDVCGVNVLIPWSAHQGEVDLSPGAVICTQECYAEHLVEQAEHRYDCLTDR